MNTIIIVLSLLLMFLLWVELEQVLTRKFLDKITQDSIKMSEENIGLLVDKIKIKNELATQVKKCLSLEEELLELKKKTCRTEINKKEIIRLHKLGRASDIIGEYVGVTWSAIRHKLRKWKKESPELFRPTKFIEAISR